MADESYGFYYTWLRTEPNFFQVPLERIVRERADEGAPIVASAVESPVAQAYQAIAAKIKHKLLTHGGLERPLAR